MNYETALNAFLNRYIILLNNRLVIDKYASPDDARSLFMATDECIPFEFDRDRIMAINYNDPLQTHIIYDTDDRGHSIMFLENVTGTGIDEMWHEMFEYD